MRHTLPKSRRLDGSQIRQFFTSCSRLDDGAFKFYFRKNGLEVWRMAVIASRKFGNAVARNRARRLIRERFRNREFPSGAGCFDVVIRLNRPAKAAETAGVFTKFLDRICKEIQNA